MGVFPLPDLHISTIADIHTLEQTAVSDLALPNSTYELLQNAAATYGDKVALRFLPKATLDEQSINLSFRQLFAGVTQTANALHQLGVDKHSVVSMLLPNLPQTHLAIWGAEAAGIFNPINPLLEVEHIAAIINEAQSKVLITLAPMQGSDLWQKAQAIKQLAPCLSHILTVNLAPSADGSQHLSDSVLDFDATIKAQPADRLISGRQFAPDDIASYFHTGGTTGTPKLAPHTHRNELVCCYQMASVVNLDAQSKCLCGLPLFHVNGVFVTGLAPWLVGAEVILATPAGYRTPALMDNFWALVERYRVSFFSCVPTILSGLLDKPSEGHDLSSLDVALCGAAPLATELMRKFERKTGIVLLEAYGQTEGTCGSTVNPKHGERRVGSVGLPLPYLKIRIVEVDAQGKWLRDCAVNEPGCVAISGPNVFSGYKQAQQNEGQWIAEGWFNTGDLGRLDEDGYLWLTGRSKDLIIRGGHNIDPQMIEEAFYQHPEVAEAVAIGKPDKRVGEVPVIFLQLQKGAGVSHDELMRHAQASIHEKAAVPKEIHLVEAMPLTAVGKIFKPQLRNQLIEQMVTDELNALLQTPFKVAVRVDKKLGQCVIVSTTAESAATVKQALADYTFCLEVNQG